MTWRRIAREWHLAAYRIIVTHPRHRPYAIWRGTEEIERHDSLANAQSRVELAGGAGQGGLDEGVGGCSL